MTIAEAGTRRAELAAFLRSRRERISPEQAGLPPGLRRRTPGLRREEVAQLAGVGVTWYTWLEQGRPINASAQVLGAVAQTLKLDQAERQHLFRLADVPDAAADPAAVPCPQVPPEVQAIMDGLVPMPACVLNERYDLLGWNEAYAALWPGVTGAAPGERNILWLNFTHPDCCHPYVSRHEQLGQAGRPVPRQLRPARRRARLDRVHRAAGRRSARTSPSCGPSTTWPARSPTSRSSGTRRSTGWP